MRALLVSGIWPPDVGGPASHAPELAAFLQGRGHEVEVVTTAAAEPAPGSFRVEWISRSLPIGARHLAVAERVRSRARRADVVYATSMIGRAALGATLARRPLVVKLTTDEAYERARRRGLFAGDLDDFQRHRGGVRVAALRRARDIALGRASRILCPSAYLRDMAVSWGVPAERVLVVANPAPELPPLPERAAARAGLGVNGGLLVLAGRIGRQKALEVALRALERVDGVSLLVAGDGPERAEMEGLAGELELGDRVRFLGLQPRVRVLELFRAADASLLSSAWENFPHTVVESLAVGTPVIATRVGGVAEVVQDGVNGLLVPPGDVGALAAAISDFFADPVLRERLGSAAAPSVADYAPERLLARVEAELARAAGT